MRDVFEAGKLFFGVAAKIDKKRLALAVVLMSVGYAATPILALLLATLLDHAFQRGYDTSLLASATALLLVLELMLAHFAHLAYFELGELGEAKLHAELGEAVNTTAGLDKLDDPHFADLCTVLQEDASRTQAGLESVLQLGGISLQTIITAVLLALVRPEFLLLPVVASAPVLLSKRAQRGVDRAQTLVASDSRLCRQVLGVLAEPATLKEVRLARAEGVLIAHFRTAWQRASTQITRAYFLAAALRSAGALIFGLGYAAAIWYVLLAATSGHLRISQVVLVVVLAMNVSLQVANGLTLLGRLQSVSLMARRLKQLRAQASALPKGPATARLPTRLRQGIALENVSFRYPGAAYDVLSGVNLEIRPGTTLAIVGDNGAGKSTLVKLITGLYQPTSGRVTVDGVDIADLKAGAWAERVAALFQDFLKLELTPREQVGSGDVARLADDAAVMMAIDEAGAGPIVRQITGGLDGAIGTGYQPGRDLSGGEWQLLSLARTRMRREPFLVSLDEPASALDAEAEHNLFIKYQQWTSGLGSSTGTAAVFVSHRFSTVLMADTIVLLKNGRVHERGSHQQLMALSGIYAELFSLQSKAYATTD